jgi:hypothetical protein
MTEPYTDLLDNFTLNLFRDVKNKFYLQLTEYINQEVLDDAYDKCVEFINDYKEKYNYDITRRPSSKKMERIMIKKEKNSDDINFETNSDFLAFRIDTEVNDIVNKLNDLENYFKDIGGLYFLRNDIIKEDTDFYLLQNSNDQKSKYKDIVVFSYGYHPKYKYIMEFQTCHPFASYVLSRNSQLRDNIDTELIDLCNNNFYGKVKDKLLKKNTHVNLFEELYLLYNYNGKLIEPELYEIIKKIENDNLKMDFIYMLVGDGYEWEDARIYLSKEEAVKASIKYPMLRVEIFGKSEILGYIPTYNYYQNGLIILA